MNSKITAGKTELIFTKTLWIYIVLYYFQCSQIVFFLTKEIYTIKESLFNKLTSLLNIFFNVILKFINFEDKHLKIHFNAKSYKIAHSKEYMIFLQWILNLNKSYCSDYFYAGKHKHLSFYKR
jgi:hypothetical protein